MSDPIRLTLPIPPSANRLHRIVRGQVKPYPNPKYTSWRNLAGWHLVAVCHGGYGGKVVKGPYTLDITVPQKLRGDVDNRVKAVADLLVEHRVTPDDRHMQSVSVRRSPDLADRIEVVVRAA